MRLIYGQWGDDTYATGRVKSVQAEGIVCARALGEEKNSVFEKLKKRPMWLYQVMREGQSRPGAENSTFRAFGMNLRSLI